LIPTAAGEARRGMSVVSRDEMHPIQKHERGELAQCLLQGQWSYYSIKKVRSTRSPHSGTWVSRIGGRLVCETTIV
jgi:hypothetical protein